MPKDNRWKVDVLLLLSFFSFLFGIALLYSFNVPTNVMREKDRTMAHMLDAWLKSNREQIVRHEAQILSECRHFGRIQLSNGKLVTCEVVDKK